MNNSGPVQLVQNRDLGVSFKLLWTGVFFSLFTSVCAGQMLQCCMVSLTVKFKTGGEILVRFPQNVFSHVFTLVGKDSFSSQSENTASICIE